MAIVPYALNPSSLSSTPLKTVSFQLLIERLYHLFINLSLLTQFKDLYLSEPLSYKLITLLTSAQPPHIILLGKSGSGKGTLSKMLASKFNYKHISIGDIHREENQKGTPLGLRIRKLVADDKIISQEMAELTFDILDHLFTILSPTKQAFIFDNFPTNLLHVPYMLRIIQKFKLQKRIIIVVPLISDEESLIRLKNRRVCSSFACGKSYNLKIAPTKIKGKCDACGSNLMVRIDDTPEIIQTKRIPFYRENILPVIEELSKKIDLYAINNIFVLFKKYLNLDI